MTRPYWPTLDWQEAAPADQGMDAGPLVEADRAIAEGMPGVLSFLIVRHGYLVFERYYQISWRRLCHNIKSVTKSVISALVGIAVEEGHLRVEQSIADFIPELRAPDSATQSKRQIQIQHLLTMTSGLRWAENGPIMFEMIRRPDWLRFILDLPLESEPGERFNYCTANTILLSAILAKATGGTTLAFAERTLFQPLGIHDVLWQRDPEGRHFGGSELYLSTRDMAKLGYLHLNQGTWEGRPVLPAEWVRRSTATQVATPDGLGYGYLWWTSVCEGYPVYFAAGYGGQRIHVVPNLDLVVAITCRSDPPERLDAPRADPPVDHILSAYVVPAARAALTWRE